MPNEVALSPMKELRLQLEAQEGQFKKVLPRHIPPERLTRVVLTAVGQNPDLMRADRRTLMGACMKAASDGLIPDGREAALVVFNTKITEGGKDRWIQSVAYMPMLMGLLKRMRNSGDVSAVVTNLVHEKDKFIQRPDDFDHPIEHRPPPLGTDRGRIIGAYALAKLKDGTKVAEVMTYAQIEQTRAVSKAKNSGPWMSWWDQMARKAVLRRLAKWMPMSAEDSDILDRVMSRDDRLGEDGGDGDAGPAIIESTAEPMTSGRMDALEAGLPADTTLDLGRSREREPARQDDEIPWDEGGAR